MPEDANQIVKKIIRDAYAELEYENQAVLEILTQFLDDGTMIGQKKGRVKKMSDLILTSLRKAGVSGDED